MGVLINTSLITSFLAGVAALFAPCCITVLLPTYFGSIFSQRRKVFIMTFVFFTGILLVFLPIGLGLGSLGTLFTRLHDWIFIGGALFLFLLAATLLFGFHPRLPFHVSPTLLTPGVPAVFMLGVFSGLATTCCAPVLAGVLALSVLPGSAFWGGTYAVGYVLGMVVPLFVIAALLDRVNLTDRFLLWSKTIRLLGREITIPTFLASLIFFAMGASILLLSVTGRLTMGSASQATANLLVTRYIDSLNSLVNSVPVFVFPSLFLITLLTIVVVTARHRTRRS